MAERLQRTLSHGLRVRGSLPRRELLALAPLLVLATHVESVRADPLDDALGRIVAARAKIRTLEASFRQTRVISLLATQVESTGSLTLVRPNRLCWHLDPPDQATYWIGPEGFAMASGEGVARVGRAAAGRFAPVLGDLLVLLGGDLRTLRVRYTLSVQEPDGRFVLVAKPITADLKKHVAVFRMEAGPELWTVERIVIEEPNADRSVIVFGPFRRDLPVDPERMRLPASAASSD